MHKKTYINWSSGKDASFALFLMLKDTSYDISLLLTTVNSHFNRVSMHGLHRNVLEAQAQALNLPLKTIELPEMPSMEDYERIMTDNIKDLVKANYTHCIFGDIFLDDLRAYRDKNLEPFNITPVYPLWKKDTKQLIIEFLKLGFKTVIVCANSKYFNEDFVGSVIDEDFIKNLPEGVDPCGENGEFHTFCFDGPIFNHPIKYKLGEKIFREYNAPKTDNTVCSNDLYGVWYCDIELENELQS